MKISEVCNICKDTTVTLFREGEFETICLVGIEQKIQGPAISFLGSIKFVDGFMEERPACVICTKEIAESIESDYDGGIVISDNPRTSFFEVHNYIAGLKEEKIHNRISESAIIHPTAIIEDNGIVIGENTVIGAHAVIKSGTVIGKNCIIRESVIIGTPGFYYFGDDEKKKLVENTGGVIIGNNVELHPQTVIEKGVLYGDTEIGDNCKLDNLVLIGHDSIIGKNCLIAGSTTFAGGVTFGDNAFAGVGVSVAPYINIGKGAKLSSGAIVTKDVADNQHVSGNFAIDHEAFIRNLKSIR